MARLDWIDNLRAVMIILVIMLHTAVTYSGLGDWYYVENEQVDLFSTLFLAFFQTFTQAYFMSLLFMIAGYFTAASLEKRSTGSFISARLYRLGVPLVAYIFIIHPVCVAMAYPDVNLAQFYLRGIMKLRFFSWTGPLWFVEALLIFSLLYVLVKNVRYRPLRASSFKISPQNVILLILLITLFAFLVRLVFPIGTDVTNLQLGFFPAYIVMYAAGTFARKYNLFSQANLEMGKRYILASFILGIPAWFLIIFFGGPLHGKMFIEGGLNWPAFFYAFWESFFCVTFIIGLISVFKMKVNHSGPVWSFLSDNAFGAYVFHAPVLISITVLAKDLAMHPVLKWIVIAPVAVAATFLVTWLARRVGILRRIFS